MRERERKREGERTVNCRREELSQKHMRKIFHTEVCSRDTSQRRDGKGGRGGGETESKESVKGRV